MAFWFADVFNYYLFEGRQVIQAEDLEERDATEVLSIYGKHEKEMQKQKRRDLLKYSIVKANKETCFVLLGIENQSDVHYAMPVKTMVYDAMNYGSQVDRVAKQHRIKKDFPTGEEFLSGFTQKDSLIPVITLTIYWGADEWTGPRRLSDMFRFDISPVKEYVNDYILNMIIPDTIEDFRKFKTEVGKVFQFIKASKSKKETIFLQESISQ